MYLFVSSFIFNLFEAVFINHVRVCVHVRVRVCVSVCRGRWRGKGQAGGGGGGGGSIERCKVNKRLIIL